MLLLSGGNWLINKRAARRVKVKLCRFISPVKLTMLGLMPTPHCDAGNGRGTVILGTAADAPGTRGGWGWGWDWSTVPPLISQESGTKMNRL
jgi:hypothetical protein